MRLRGRAAKSHSSKDFLYEDCKGTNEGRKFTPSMLSNSKKTMTKRAKEELKKRAEIEWKWKEEKERKKMKEKEELKR